MDGDDAWGKRGDGRNAEGAESGGLQAGLVEHLASETEELIDGERASEEAKGFGSKGIGVSRGCEVSERGSVGLREDEDGDPGQAGMEFGDEGGPADSLHGVGGDDKAEPAGELGLLDEAESFGCI
jgi:hypothetical protein